MEGPLRLIEKLVHYKPKTRDEQIVLLSQVLACDINQGYEDMSNMQVLKVNGTAVVNLRCLAGLVEGCKDEYLRLELDEDAVLILNRAAATEATPAIMKTHSIAADRSADLTLPEKEDEIVGHGHPVEAAEAKQ